jgi:hypothetical protein
MTTITFYTYPENIGSINAGGTVYRSGQTADLLINIRIPIGAIVPADYVFLYWKYAIHNTPPYTPIVEIDDISSASTYMTIKDAGGWVQAYFVPAIPSQWTLTFHTYPNIGSISLDSLIYTDNTSIQIIEGTYTVTANPPDGYIFDHWIRTGGIRVADLYTQTTTMTVTNNGNLQANWVPILPPPKARIDSVSAPSSANAGDSISVKISLYNAGAAGILWGGIDDKNTGEIVGAQEPIQLEGGASGELDWALTMPNKDWNLLAKAGH